MKIIFTLIAYLLLSSTLSAQGPTLPDVDQMTLEELEQLPPEILNELPMKQLMARIFEGTEAEISEDTLELMVWLPLRELSYIGDPGSISNEQLTSAVRAFQSDLGAEVTGDLTYGQYTTLARMFQRRRDTPVYAPIGTSVYIYDSFAFANGTWIIEGDNIANPINTSEIRCYREGAYCLVIQADVVVPSLDSQDEPYNLYLSINRYEVISWSDSEVIAQASGEPLIGPKCRSALLTLNVESEEVYEITRNANTEGCGDPDLFTLPPLESPQISRLVDGFQETYEFWKERRSQTNKYMNSSISELEVFQRLQEQSSE